MNQPATGPRLVQAVAHAVQILDCFLQQQRPLTLAEVNAALDLNKSSVYRLLETLVAGGLLAKDAYTRGYTLGIKVAQLAGQLGTRFQLVDLAAPLLQRLRDGTGETAALHVRIGDGRLCISQLASPRPVRMMLEVNQPYPLHRGAAGKAFLAHLPAPYVRDLAAGLPPVERHALLSQLGDVRRLGFAVSRSEIIAETTSVCAPVLDRAGQPVVVVGVHGPAYRVADADLPALGATVRAIAAEMARLLQA